MTDVEIWKKRWFQLLKPLEKCIWNYLKDTCTPSGIWEVNFEEMSFKIGERITENNLDFLGTRILKFEKDKYFITGVPNFLSGKLDPNTGSKPVLSCIEELKRYGLWKYFETGYYIGPEQPKVTKKESPILEVPFDATQLELEQRSFKAIKSVEDQKKDFAKVCKEIRASQIWQMEVAKLNQLGVDTVIDYLEAFLKGIELKDEFHRNLRETKAYFLNWVKLEKTKNPAKPKSASGGNKLK